MLNRRTKVRLFKKACYISGCSDLVGNKVMRGGQLFIYIVGLKNIKRIGVPSVHSKESGETYVY